MGNSQKRGLNEKTIMPSSGAYGKLLFVLPVYAHTPEEFLRQWQRGLERLETFMVGRTPEDHTNIPAQQIELAHNLHDPRSPRYHDIIGYVELYLSHNRFEADYYFKPDRRRRFWRGRDGLSGRNPRCFYQWCWQRALVNTTHLHTLEEKSAALGEALVVVKEEIEKLGCYMDISLETQLLKCLNVPKLVGWT